MREIQASEAKTHLPKLLNAVMTQGETIVITRHGHPVARLIPEVTVRRAEKSEAIERLKALRAVLPSVSKEELLSARHEGHKY